MVPSRIVDWEEILASGSSKTTFAAFDNLINSFKSSFFSPGLSPPKSINLLRQNKFGKKPQEEATS